VATEPIAEERRTTPVELLWDLVFVFAVTQVTTLLSRDLSWAGLGRSMLVLALVWWAWSAFVWAANAQDTASPTLRLVLLLAMVLTFVAGLALPHAFDDEAPVFALAYAAVRFLHLGLYADASRRGNASWAAIAGFAVTVAIGVGASEERFDAQLVAGVTLGLLITIALWWTYFDRFAAVAEERLRVHDDPVLAAADAYSYLHLVLVAGIIIFAVGVKIAVHDVREPLGDAARLALCGGVALYLVAHVAFRMRLVGSVGVEKLVAAAALLVLYAAGGALAAWALAGAVTVVLGAMCAVESVAARRAEPLRTTAG